MIDFMTGTIDALSECLPVKFYLAGHSYGGYLASLYASKMPNRIEALFLISPMIQSYIEETYNPYAYQHNMEPWRLWSKKEADD